MSYEFLTGGTGFLGSYLLRDALISGQSVAVLARAGRRASAQDRIDEVLDRFQGDLPAALPAPRVIEGDLNEPDLGLDGESRTWIRENCTRVLHCAASVSFVAQGGEPYRSNVDGTRSVLDLCRESRIRDFHLVSTAYVCGSGRTRVMEADFECGQQFSNDYERSKFVCEHLVRHSPHLDRWSIYRPSVIVGDSATGYTSNFNGVYAFAQVAAVLSRESPEGGLSQLGMAVADRVNFVPVDWVSAVIRALMERSQDASVTYHLTNPEPSRLGDLIGVSSSVLTGDTPVPVGTLDSLIEVYRPYLTDHCDFDRTNTQRDVPDLPCPRLEGEVFDRLMGFVAERRSGATTGFHRSTALAFSVLGPPDRHVDLSSPTSPVELDPGDVDEATVRAACGQATLKRLRDGDLSTEDAIYSGLVAFEGDPTQLDHAASLLGEFLDFEQSAGRRPVTEGSA